KNLARGGTAVQSSLYGNGVAGRAIDGNRAHICTRTKRQYRPWWRLDLLKRYEVNTVVITSNSKDCCLERISEAQIRIGDSLHDNGNINPVCAVISSIPAGASQTFKCNGMEGRYVNIVVPKWKEHLTLCEVEGGVLEDFSKESHAFSVNMNMIVEVLMSDALEMYYVHI
uniref:fucolectin-1-like n=1 Tax=Centroberyx gerrardi TaxID=166262 RepID=UPI003AAD3F89